MGMKIGAVLTGISVILALTVIMMISYAQGPEVTVTTDQSSTFSLEFVIMIATVALSVGGAAFMLREVNRRVNVVENALMDVKACLSILQSHVADRSIHMGHDGLVTREEYERRHQEMINSLPAIMEQSVSTALRPFLDRILPRTS
jgi:hypothetical protein